MTRRYHLGLDRVVLSSMPVGRAIALHGHRRNRVRKKYRSAVVVLRQLTTPETIHNIMQNLMRQWALSETGKRRFCHVLRKLGIDAHVDRRRQ